MRKLIVSENITLDGVMEAPDLQYQSDDMAEALQAQMQAADALLLGRVTYEEFAGFWPLQTDDGTGVAPYINSVAKFVVSSTLDKADWHNTTILSGDPVEEVATLKQQSGANITVTGSGELAQALMQAGLVDEVRLFVNPLVRGQGKRLFPDGFAQTFRLVEATPFSAGAVMLRYELSKGAQ